MIPSTGIDVSGELNLIAGAGHSGQLLSLYGVDRCNLKDWQINATLPSVITSGSLFDLEYMTRGSFPRISVGNQVLNYGARGNSWMFNMAFCHNMSIHGFYAGRITVVYDNPAADAWYYVVNPGFGSFYTTVGRDSIVIHDFRVEDTQGSANLRELDVNSSFKPYVLARVNNNTADGTHSEYDATGSYGATVNVF